MTDSLYSTSSEGTYHCKFEKCAGFRIPLTGENINIILSNKTFWVLIFEIINITWSYLIIFSKYMEPQKELTRFTWSNPQQKCWTCVTFGHLSWFSWTETIQFISFIHFKDYYLEIRYCKEKHMLTNNFSCYKLNNKSNPLQRKEKFTKT